MSGKQWMYSNQPDDEDLEFARHKFFTYRKGIAYYRLTEKNIVRMAKKAGAVYKIDGKMVRPDGEDAMKWFPATGGCMRRSRQDFMRSRPMCRK